MSVLLTGEGRGGEGRGREGRGGERRGGKGRGGEGRGGKGGLKCMLGSQHPPTLPTLVLLSRSEPARSTKFSLDTVYAALDSRRERLWGRDRKSRISQSDCILCWGCPSPLGGW